MTMPKYDTFPDEAHQDLLNRAFAADQSIRDQTISVSDAMMLISGLADLAQQLGAAIPASEATHAAINARIDAETARAKTAEKTTADLLAALTARVATVEALRLRGITGQKTQALPIAGIGATTTVAVAFPTAMPDANYVPLVDIATTATALLGTLSVVYPVTNKTTTGCTVTIKNSSLLAVAASVTVTVAAIAYS
jgi:hypothetical protein